MRYLILLILGIILCFISGAVSIAEAIRYFREKGITILVLKSCF